LKKFSNEIQGVGAGDEPAPSPAKPRRTVSATNRLWSEYRLNFKVCIFSRCL